MLCAFYYFPVISIMVWWNINFQQVHIIPIVGVGKIYQRCTLKVAAVKVGALVSADVS